jgi:hypothetical protein
MPSQYILMLAIKEQSITPAMVDIPGNNLAVGYPLKRSSPLPSIQYPTHPGFSLRRMIWFSAALIRAIPGM